jgi:hypothetical protein
MRRYLLGAFAILVAGAASPALAQEMGGATGPGSRYGLEPQGYYDQGYPAYYDQGYRRPYYGESYYRGDGFDPFDAATDVVGGAVGTAGAVATAPFRAFGNNDSYAMARGDNYCAQRYRSYDPASGSFMGYDGRRHPCP